MSYFIEFQPKEINLVWSVLLEGKVTGKDAPLMTAILKNIQNTVEGQDEYLKNKKEELEKEEETTVDMEPPAEIEVVDPEVE